MSNVVIVGEKSQKLTEFTKDEFRPIAKLLDPEFTEEKYDRDWEKFLDVKRAKLGVQGNA